MLLTVEPRLQPQLEKHNHLGRLYTERAGCYPNNRALRRDKRNFRYLDNVGFTKWKNTEVKIPLTLEFHWQEMLSRKSPRLETSRQKRSKMRWWRRPCPLHIYWQLPSCALAMGEVLEVNFSTANLLKMKSSWWLHPQRMVSPEHKKILFWGPGTCLIKWCYQYPLVREQCILIRTWDFSMRWRTWLLPPCKVKCWLTKSPGWVCLYIIYGKSLVQLQIGAR